ncbi:hypothetical protein ACIO1C_01850 [Streptomyces sp. NPDC087420]|uniref:hypothetical protein n=1 Tax=Streptomyces sp. NPDC087420 TaxID=3365785 RepID=UPI0038393532
MNSADGLLALVGEHLESVRASLGPERYNLLLTRVRALTDGAGSAKEQRRDLQGVRLVLLDLPFDHPVRLALDSNRLLATTDLPRTVVQARELLARLAEPAPGPEPVPSTAEIIAGVRRRLLAAPSLSAREVRTGTAAEAAPSELIRLDDPLRGARYPAFQFAGGTADPLPVVRRVNRLLLADVDPWGAAHWWLSGNTWLGGPPASLLGELPDRALADAARALVEGDR